MSAVADAPRWGSVERADLRHRPDRRREARFRLASDGVVAAYLQDVARVRRTSEAPSRRSGAGSGHR